jgi:hypothetical protein
LESLETLEDVMDLHGKAYEVNKKTLGERSFVCAEYVQQHGLFIGVARKVGGWHEVGWEGIGIKKEDSRGRSFGCNRDDGCIGIRPVEVVHFMRPRPTLQSTNR